ncbi:protein Barley B recombinant-like isoform X1 [Typha latifolia]|uniref:protein Barley B recombinant-like isoform X1 n=2 Tax=Typha latifolia TaxID=4733 RepID=UPI003C2E2C93
MEDSGGFGMRNWAYYDQPMKSNLGLQLMSSAAERDTKQFLSNGEYLHPSCSVAEPPIPMEFMRNGWMNHRESKMIHMLPVNHNYTILPNAHGDHLFPMMQHTPEIPNRDKDPPKDEPQSRKNGPLKKSQARAEKASKPKKPKKIPLLRDENSNRAVSRGKNGRKSTDMVINGIDLDISGIPTPVCSCTGTPQNCYRWGVGGWQSACCTTGISVYPLPMSTKRRGARIAGRKMSLGAFKKVLEKLAGEGYNLSNPIDLKTYWAKHGTNKFVTIR